MIAKPALGFVGYFISDANEVLVARFDAYEQRVTTLAEAATGEDGGRQDRLIRSVRAFALNDCAMAHFEYAHGTGRWSG